MQRGNVKYSTVFRQPRCGYRTTSVTLAHMAHHSSAPREIKRPIPVRALRRNEPLAKAKMRCKSALSQQFNLGAQSGATPWHEACMCAAGRCRYGSRGSYINVRRHLPS